jgi:hypothetical protein
MGVLMDDRDVLERFGAVPLEYSALREVYRGYASPAGKVAELCKKGYLTRIKRGLYSVSPKIARKPVDEMLIANHLCGPSYVSLQTALEYHGLIPEAVYTVISVTPKRSKNYNTPFGRFEYLTVPMAYYKIGIDLSGNQNGYTFLIASPEKALCDMIVLTRGLRIRSSKAMFEYLAEDMRIDLDEVKGFDREIVRECMDAGGKPSSLKYFLEIIDA